MRRHRASGNSLRQSQSFGKTGLVVGIAVLASIVGYAALASDFGTTRYEDFFPSAAQLSKTQQLTRKSHRAKFGKNCKNYGVATDPFFGRFGGQYCGKENWESHSQFETSPEKFLHSFETVMKVFETADDCKEYFYRFYGIHMYEPVAYPTMMDVTENSPRVGDENHVFLWDPTQAQGVMPLEGSYLNKHVVYVFRSGRTFVKVSATGHIQAAAAELTPNAVAEISQKLHNNIRKADCSPLTRQVRKWMDSGMTSAQKTLGKAQSIVIATYHQVVKTIWDKKEVEDSPKYPKDNYTNFGDDDYDVRGIVDDETVGAYYMQQLLDGLTYFNVAGTSGSDLVLFVSSLVSVFVLLIGSLAMSPESDVDIH